MDKLVFKPSYDVVIIGAGVGGLTAGALLSKAGFSVCLLEKEPHVGGYLAGFRRKDFRFDTAIHWLTNATRMGWSAGFLTLSAAIIQRRSSSSASGGTREKILTTCSQVILTNGEIS